MEVFVYLDKEGNALATPKCPKFQVDDLALLKVTSTTPYGAFLDMGIPKDLLIPRKLQKFPMAQGEIHLVMILREKDTQRLYGTSKVESYLRPNLVTLNPTDSVQVTPYYRTPLGYKVLIKNKHLGMIYHNEIFTDIVIGQSYPGSVKFVRDDGQVDCLIQEVGLKKHQSNSEKILEKLCASSHGKLSLWDKSSPKDIENSLQMSKSAFKKSVGILFKNKKIHLGEGYISLL